MDVKELMECWDNGNWDIVAAILVHDAHPNIIIDFTYQLNQTFGIEAVDELKELIRVEYEKNERQSRKT